MRYAKFLWLCTLIKLILIRLGWNLHHRVHRITKLHLAITEYCHYLCLLSAINNEFQIEFQGHMCRVLVNCNESIIVCHRMMNSLFSPGTRLYPRKFQDFMCL